MASLRWVADGIEAAEAAGGVTLELYHRPGFIGGPGVRRSRGELAGGSGFELIADPEPDVDEDDDDHARDRGGG